MSKQIFKQSTTILSNANNIQTNQGELLLGYFFEEVQLTSSTHPRPAYYLTTRSPKSGYSMDDALVSINDVELGNWDNNRLLPTKDPLVVMDFFQDYFGFSWLPYGTDWEKEISTQQLKKNPGSDSITTGPLPCIALYPDGDDSFTVALKPIHPCESEMDKMMYYWMLTNESTKRQYNALSNKEDFLLIKVNYSECKQWMRTQMARLQWINDHESADKALTKLIRANRAKHDTDLTPSLIFALYLEHSKDGVSDEDLRTEIHSLPKTIDLHASLTDSDIHCLMANYTYVINKLCNAFDPANIRKPFPMHTQPNELTELCVRLLNPKPGSSVFNPFAGICDYAIALPDSHTISAEIDNIVCLIARIRFDALGMHSTLHEADAIGMLIDPESKYQNIIMTPSFGQMYPYPKEVISDRYGELWNEVGRTRQLGNIDLLALSYAIDRADKVVCVLPMRFAYSGEYSRLREELITSHRLRSVIALPKIFQPHTSIDTCVVVIDNDTQNDKVLLVDGRTFFDKSKYTNRGNLLWQSLLGTINSKSSDYCHTASSDEISLNGFNLVPARYLLQIPDNSVKLSDLIELVPTQSSMSTRLISPSDFPLDFLNGTAIPHETKEMPVQIADGPVIAVGVIGRLKAARIVGANLPFAKDIILFRVKASSINEDYLLTQLMTSTNVQKQFEAFAIGIGVTRISMQDFLNIRIEVPSLDKQSRIVEGYLKGGLSEAEERYFNLLASYKNDTRMKKHAIGQDLMNLIAAWDNLMKVQEKNNGIISSSFKYGNMFVSEIEDSIGNLIEIIRRQIDSFTIKDDYSKKDQIPIVHFLESFMAQNKHPEFSYDEIIVDSDVLEAQVNFSPGALTRILKNIVFNACSHGFHNEADTNHRVSISVSKEDNSIVVYIANNGEPISPKAASSLFEYGFSTNRGHSGHSGLGCYEAKSLMTECGGDLLLDTDPDGEFPVIFKLIFNTNILSDDEK